VPWPSTCNSPRVAAGAAGHACARTQTVKHYCHCQVLLLTLGMSMPISAFAALLSGPTGASAVLGRPAMHMSYGMHARHWVSQSVLSWCAMGCRHSTCCETCSMLNVCGAAAVLYCSHNNAMCAGVRHSSPSSERRKGTSSCICATSMNELTKVATQGPNPCVVLGLRLQNTSSAACWGGLWLIRLLACCCCSVMSTLHISHCNATLLQAANSECAHC